MLLSMCLAALAAIQLAGCGNSETPVFTTQFIAFDSAVDLSIVSMSKQDAMAVAAEIQRDFQFIDRSTHAWEPGPMVRVNELLSTEQPFAVPPSLLPLIRQSQVLAQQSGNLFNPAIGHLQRLWGFHTHEPECQPPPSSASIARLVKAAPSMADLYLEDIMLQSDNPAVMLDFGSFATGYAMDLAIETLSERGVRNAMINAGGDIRAIGSRTGRAWRVPVRRGNGTRVLGIINVIGDASVFTSSDYRRNFIHDDKIYHHVLDPRTGYPVEGVHAVTVLYDGSAAVAGAAATALMVAGLERWQETAQHMGIRYVLLIDDEGTIHMTPAMAERIELLDTESDVVLSETRPGEETPPR
ncbi:MAG TPA: thiamine biosynthesis protein ApbE [Chromatiaceae bacterium]|nr:MAG: FAD:protein FMN transferase [Thiohalocapsa sp. PB-PSB1]HBG96771.1 thiamine biosynthesis protein ApbE [Chromatiaceae bacterium]HCS91689.1 thiamine biosynthesis protein ApbE [Chromatiaceae bacterium]